jgi:hypothetical protein
MRATICKFHDWFVVIALAIALTSVGFAHRLAPNGITPELAAYVAAGGQLSDICGAADGDNTPVSSDCEACRLTDNFVQPIIVRTVHTERAETLVLAFVAKRISERNDLDPARLTRAPPQA